MYKNDEIYNEARCVLKNQKSRYLFCMSIVLTRIETAEDAKAGLMNKKIPWSMAYKL